MQMTPSNYYNMNTGNVPSLPAPSEHPAIDHVSKKSDELKGQPQKPIETTRKKTKNVFEEMNLAAGDFLAFQDGLSLIKWGESHLSDQTEFRAFANTTHIATVVEVTSEHIKILEADEKHGLQTRTFTPEAFKTYISAGKAGVGVIKQLNNDKLAQKIVEVAKDFAVQFPEKKPFKGNFIQRFRNWTKGGYDLARFPRGVISGKKNLHNTESSNKRIVNTVNQKEIEGRYILTDSKGTARTKDVCSSLASAILKTAQVALAYEEEQAQGNSDKLSVERVAGWSRSKEGETTSKVLNLNEKFITPAAFVSTLTGTLGFRTIRIITPDSIVTAQRKIARHEEARKMEAAEKLNTTKLNESTEGDEEPGATSFEGKTEGIVNEDQEQPGAPVAVSQRPLKANVNSANPSSLDLIQKAQEEERQRKMREHH